MNRSHLICVCVIAISFLAGCIILANAFNNIADAITNQGNDIEHLGTMVRDGLLKLSGQ